MLGIDRRTLQIFWTLFLLLLALTITYLIGGTLIIFAVALIFAHLLAPAVNFIERRFPPRVPRVASLAIVYVALLVVLVLAMIPITSRISGEAAALASKLPDLLKADPMAHLPIPQWLEPMRPQVTNFVHDRLSDLGQAIGPLATRAGAHILSGIGLIVTAVLVPILAFFFLKDGSLMRDSIVDSFDLKRRALVDNIFNDIHLLLGQYIRALVLLAIATFTFYSIFLSIMGVPYPVLLAGLASLLEFIPAIGPFVGAVVIIIVAATTGAHVLILIVFLGVYRLFQDYVLNPYLMSAGVAIHPLMVLFGVLAGEQLLGIPGMFFSVPTIAALRLILIRLRRRRTP